MFSAGQICQVGTRHARRVPNKRLSTVLITTRANEDILMRFARRPNYVFLNFPELVRDVRRVSSIVTELVSVHVLTGRPNTRGERLVVYEEVMDGRAIRLLNGPFLASNRGCRAIGVLLREPRMLPTITLTSIQDVIIQQRIPSGLSLIVAKLRREACQVMSVPMVAKALVGLIHGLLVTRLLYRANCAVIVVYVFRYFEG